MRGEVSILRFAAIGSFLLLLASLLAALPALRSLWQGGGSQIVRHVPIEIDKVYTPSGWLGDAVEGKEVFQADFSNAENPRISGRTVMRFSYLPGRLRWAGLSWIYPQNNWGDHPGIRIEGAKQLSFWAAGARGGESLEFKLGGTFDSAKAYQDSGQRKLGPVALTREWRQYVIKLDDSNLDNLITAFVWVASAERNSGGITFYLDAPMIE
jgi:hypothetical protein